MNLVASMGNGATTLFWLDNWVESRALADIWPHLFLGTPNKEGTVRDLANKAGDSPWIRSIVDNLTNNHSLDRKHWRLTANRVFTVKSFYNFLNDGGLRCRWTPIILKGYCPKKVSMFNWLAWDDKILSLENLTRKRCNFVLTTTCVMCHAEVESANHLLIQCPVARHIWDFFGQLFDARHCPDSLHDL